MELKIFRDTMPQAGTVCTVKAELPLETEILVSESGHPAKAAAAGQADTGGLSALYGLLSGRGGYRSLPDRTETALYKAAGTARI